MYVMSQIEFAEVLAEHDEKREIVLDNTVKDNQSYLILGSTKKKQPRLSNLF